MRDPESMLPLTPLWFSILLSLADQSRHGYAIIKQIEARTSGAMSPAAGTVYLALQRLVEEGVIQAVPGEPSESKRPRKLYDLTPFGRAVAVAEAGRVRDQANWATESFALPAHRDSKGS